jgi:hypothetical protein
MPDFTGPLLMDAQTFISTQGSGNYISEVVCVVLAASAGARQTYRAQKDGWVAGLLSTGGVQWHCAINVDPPSALIQTAGIYNGWIWYGCNGTMADRIAAQSGMRVPFVQNDAINFTNTTATLTCIAMVLSYPR